MGFRGQERRKIIYSVSKYLPCSGIGNTTTNMPDSLLKELIIIRKDRKKYITGQKVILENKDAKTEIR